MYLVVNFGVNVDSIIGSHSDRRVRQMLMGFQDNRPVETMERIIILHLPFAN